MIYKTLGMGHLANRSPPQSWTFIVFTEAIEGSVKVNSILYGSLDPLGLIYSPLLALGQ